MNLKKEDTDDYFLKILQTYKINSINFWHYFFNQNIQLIPFV